MMMTMMGDDDYDDDDEVGKRITLTSLIDSYKPILAALGNTPTNTEIMKYSETALTNPLRFLSITIRLSQFRYLSFLKLGIGAEGFSEEYPRRNFRKNFRRNFLLFRGIKYFGKNVKIFDEL